MANLHTCVVCFDDTSSVHTCIEDSCECKICSDCLKNLITISAEEKISPCCPFPSCKSLFNIQTFSPEETNLYLTQIHNIYTSDESYQTIKARTEESFSKVNNMVINPENTFPKGIAFLIKLYMNQTEIDKIKESFISNLSKITLEPSNFIKKCPIPDCKGYLSTKNICVICNTEVCSKCKIIKNDIFEHECSENDLKSLELIKTIRQCPNCLTPIEKNDGCDYITCGKCRTNFSYSTGKKSEMGSHNKLFKLKNETLSHDQVIEKLTKINPNIASNYKAYIDWLDRTSRPNIESQILQAKENASSTVNVEYRIYDILFQEYHYQKQRNSVLNSISMIEKEYLK